MMPVMRNPRSRFLPLAIGAPSPLREIPVGPMRMIHFFDPSSEKMLARLPDMAASADLLLGNLEDAIPADRKEAARAGPVRAGRGILDAALARELVTILTVLASALAVALAGDRAERGERGGGRGTAAGGGAGRGRGGRPAHRARGARPAGATLGGGAGHGAARGGGPGRPGLHGLRRRHLGRADERAHRGAGFTPGPDRRPACSRATWTDHARPAHG